jgi:hypothetical protein
MKLMEGVIKMSEDVYDEEMYDNDADNEEWNGEKAFYIEDGVELAPSPFLKPLRNKGYGSLPDLSDEELASPEELERAYYKELWGPIWLLPNRKRYNQIWDISGDVDYNAFASVDFDRLRPEFDKARYKADKLGEQLRDVLIIYAIINERVQKKVKYKLLKLVGTGRIEADQIKDWDMWQLAKYYMRILKLCGEIRRLHKYSRDCRQKKLQEMFDSLG